MIDVQSTYKEGTVQTVTVEAGANFSIAADTALLIVNTVSGTSAVEATLPAGEEGQKVVITLKGNGTDTDKVSIYKPAILDPVTPAALLLDMAIALPAGNGVIPFAAEVAYIDGAWGLVAVSNVISFA